MQCINMKLDNLIYNQPLLFLNKMIKKSSFSLYADSLGSRFLSA